MLTYFWLNYKISFLNTLPQIYLQKQGKWIKTYYKND